jgi:trimethylamine--corrinoid protein Co-methyltransferase
VLDLNEGVRRASNREDAKEFSILADALEKVEGIYPAVAPQDVPGQISHLWATKILLENSEKHCLLTPTTPEEARYMIEMASAIVGSTDELSKRPILKGGFSTTSPLRFSPEVLGAMIEFATHNLPMSLLPCVMGGATGPVTLAGILALSNAETLFAIAISQVIKEGTPVVYSANPRITDMRTGMNLHAAPESLLVKAASAQLARYYGLIGTAGHNTDSKLPDFQCSFEKALMLAFIIRTEPEISGIHGGLDSGLMSCKEQYIIDNEILGYVLRVIRGIEVSDENLALDTIDEVVRKAGSFLGTDHTRRNWRKEFLIPSISMRDYWDAWVKKGKKSLVERAGEKVETILKTHYPTPLDKDVQREIDKLIHEAEKTIYSVT